MAKRITKSKVKEAEDKQTEKVPTDRLEAVASEVAEEIAAQQPEGLQLSDLNIGYVVGLSEEGDFVFQVFGTDVGLVQLLGIHHHATEQVKLAYDEKRMTGDRLVHEVGKAVGVLKQQLDQVLQAVAPKEPDNKLLS